MSGGMIWTRDADRLISNPYVIRRLASNRYLACYQPISEGQMPCRRQLGLAQTKAEAMKLCEEHACTTP